MLHSQKPTHKFSRLTAVSVIGVFKQQSSVICLSAPLSAFYSFWVPNQRFEIRAVYIRRDMTPGVAAMTRSIWSNAAELASTVIPAWRPNFPALGRLSILGDSYKR
jgi:hypothetical protein